MHVNKFLQLVDIGLQIQQKHGKEELFKFLIIFLSKNTLTPNQLETLYKAFGITLVNKAITYSNNLLDL